MNVFDELREIYDIDDLAFCQKYIKALEERIDELVPQCDAAYTPYREMVNEARAETDKVSMELYRAEQRISELEQLNTDLAETLKHELGEQMIANGGTQ
jgi:hypothetical protein